MVSLNATRCGNGILAPSSRRVLHYRASGYHVHPAITTSPPSFKVRHHQYPPLSPPHPYISDMHLHLRPSSPPTPPTPPMPEPKHQHPQRTNQPQESINQIHPNRMLHPRNPAIPLRVRLDIHIAKQSKERDPEDEQDRVERPGEWDARGEGDEVEQGQDGGEGGDYFGEDLCADIPRLAFVLGREGVGLRGGRQTHFPSLYLRSLSALCRSTP
jgi:hypothetical protein